MAAVKNFGSVEIIQIADAVAREKNIDRQLIVDAMENSIAIAARKKYGHDKNITASINPKSGEISLLRNREVVADDYETAEESEDEISNEESADQEIRLTDSQIIRLTEAKLKKEDAVIGDILSESLPPIDLGRVAAQTAKQVIVQKVRDAERERQHEDFKGRVGEVVHGTVKRVEFGNVIVDLGNAEAIIERPQLIKGESFRVNERVRAYLKEVRRELKGPQIFLSRTAPEFMAKLFTQEVPEIYDGIIEIKGVAREPGSRAKIAVYSNDPSIDPIGSCVGVRGSRVQAVISELQGEKIDIVQWSSDPATFLVNALSQTEVTKVVIDEDSDRIEVVVPDDQLSLAIGRRGQNVRLASELIGWQIDIMTEEDESTRRNEDFNRVSSLFIEALNIEEIIAHLLVSEGFFSVEEVAYVEPSELAAVEGFDDDIVSELQARAVEYLNIQQEKIEAAFKEYGVADDLASFEGLEPEVIVQLAQKGITTLDDVADLSHDEFVELLPDSGLTDEQINDAIMEARGHWFENEEDAVDQQEQDKNAQEAS